MVRTLGVVNDQVTFLERSEQQSCCTAVSPMIGQRVVESHDARQRDCTTTVEARSIVSLLASTQFHTCAPPLRLKERGATGCG